MPPATAQGGDPRLLPCPVEGGRDQPCVRCTHLQSQAAPPAPNLRLPLSGAAHQVRGRGLELEGPCSPFTDVETEASAGHTVRPGQRTYLALCHTPSQSSLVEVRARAGAWAGMLGLILGWGIRQTQP